MKTVPDVSAFGSSENQYSYGLTKREYFAAQIMAGFAAHKGEPTIGSDAADVAVNWADSLVAALNAEPEEKT